MPTTPSTDFLSTRTQWSNWAKNVTCQAYVHYPESEEAVQAIVQQAAALGQTIRVVGEGHSFSPLIETKDCILSLSKMCGLIEVNSREQTATVWAGTTIKAFNNALFEQGMAMINLGDIDVQSLAGATATGTHGTGLAFGNISSQMVGFSIVTAEGTLRHCSKSKNSTLFEAGRISLGALGIITKMTLKVIPAYQLEYTSKVGDFETTMQQLEQLNATHRNFEYYYFPHSETVQLKQSNVTQKPLQPKPLATGNKKIEDILMQAVCAIVGRFSTLYKWVSRRMAKGIVEATIIDHSHRVYPTVHGIRFREMEYNIPLNHFDACMRRLKKRIETDPYPVFLPIECRFVKGDDCWLSPAYRRDSAYIAIHVPAIGPYEAYFQDVEMLMMEYDGRPHWGKMHTRTAASLRAVYPMWDDFLALRDQLDPQGLFLNDYLRKVLLE